MGSIILTLDLILKFNKFLMSKPLCPGILVLIRLTDALDKNILEHLCIGIFVAIEPNRLLKQVQYLTNYPF